MSFRMPICAVGMVLAALSCGPTVTVRHEVEPIHVTVDVYVRVERELEEFFAFEEEFKGEEPDYGDEQNGKQ
ncbi:MAG: YnbE family lipoprotein [Chitinivibrionales bacterium]|nr:YnbE family lipoprotein [Chitinivibrionales bacterium]